MGHQGGFIYMSDTSAEEIGTTGGWLALLLHMVSHSPGPLHMVSSPAGYPGLPYSMVAKF